MSSNNKTISLEFNKSELHDLIQMFKDLNWYYFKTFNVNPDNWQSYQKIRDAYTEIQGFSQFRKIETVK